MTDTSAHSIHSEGADTSGALPSNFLIAEFVAECGRRNIAPPPPIVHALAGTVTTGIFELQDCMLGENAIGALCHALAHVGPATAQHVPLKQLSLRNAYIGDLGAMSVLRYVIKHAAPTLEVLELSGNSLQDCAGDIATAVAVLVKLEKLVLDWNKIGTGCVTLPPQNNSKENRAPSASRAASVESATAAAASQSQSQIPMTGVHRLLQALTSHHALTHISLQNNLLGRGAVEDICTLIGVSQTVEHLDISWNSLGEAGGTRIANALHRAAQSTKLTRLETQGNSFARKDCEAIERKLRANRDADSAAAAAAAQEQELRTQLERVQREVLDLRGQLAEVGAKANAGDMLLGAAKDGEERAKAERAQMEKLMKEAQDTLHAERLNYQRKLDEEHQRCTEAIEQASRRVREACEQADAAESKARVQRAEMDGELATARDRKYAAERESQTAVATAAAAQQAMERTQSEHGALSRSLTESRQRVAELELQLKVRADELERMRGQNASHSVDLESVKAQLRAAQESDERHKLKIRDHEHTIERAEKHLAEELASALARAESGRSEELAEAQREARAAQHAKESADRTIGDLKTQFEGTRRQFEASAAEATAHADKMRDQCQAAELELEKTLSKSSLLEIEAGRHEGRAKAAEERARVLHSELQSSLSTHQDRLEDLAREFERKLSDRDSEVQDRAREARVLAEELALVKAKNDALSAKMKQSQVELEKRVVKSLRNAMLDVQKSKGSAADTASTADSE